MRVGKNDILGQQESEFDPTVYLIDNNNNNNNNNHHHHIPPIFQNYHSSDETQQPFQIHGSQQYAGYGQQPNLLFPQQQFGQIQANQPYYNNNEEQENDFLQEQHLWHAESNNEYYYGPIIGQSSEQNSQCQITQNEMFQLEEIQPQQNVQEDHEYQSQQNQLNQSQHEEIPEEDEQDSSASSKSAKKQEGTKEKRKRKITKVKHNLDGKLVDKLKNFYRNLMSRIQGALSPIYKNNKDMLQLIKHLCLKSNQRNFLKLFPRMNEDNNEIEQKHNKIEDDEDSFQDQSDKSYDRQLLLELREKANAIFGKNFHKMVCLYKSNNSFKNKEEFFYGCLFYAERSAKKSPVLSSERSPVKPNQVFAFNFEKTLFPETQYLSYEQEIASLSEQNVQQYYYPSMSPQCSQEPDSPTIFHF